ncbi:MAG: hypothetical protein CMH54_03405 [Myxococcales bacterium]|nr:hypothetical protein [Myxococcales bacterium]
MVVKRMLITRLFAALLMVGTLVSCGGGDELLKLNLVLYTPPSGPNPYEGVDWLRITARDANNKELVYDYVPLSYGAAQLKGIPYGTRQIVVEGHPTRPNTQEPYPEVILSRGGTPLVSMSTGSAEVYAPVYMIPSNTFVQTAKAPLAAGPGAFATGMSLARVGMTVTKLDDGNVVIAGGAFLSESTGSFEYATDLNPGTFRDSVEIYDVKDGTFTNTSTDSFKKLTHARAYHASVTLTDGRIAFLGGLTSINGQITAVKTVEVLDPSTGNIQYMPHLDLDMPRAYHTVTPIPGNTGRYLIVGGLDNASGNWAIWSELNGIEGTGNLLTPRYAHTATAVPGSNLVIITGGENANGMAGSMEIFNGAANTFESQAIALPYARSFHTASYVPQRGFIYLAGGFGDYNHTTLVGAVDVFHVPTRQYQATGFAVSNPRAVHTAVVMEDNRVLLSGGMTLANGNYTPTATSEMIFEHLDATGQNLTIMIGDAANMPTSRFLHHGIALDTGLALLVGGATSSNAGVGYSGPLPGLIYNR